MNRHGSSERGSVLVIALLVLAVLLLIGSAFLSVSLSERSIAVNQTNSGKSFNVAEAGIEHARFVLNTTDVDALLIAGGNLFNGQNLDRGSYTVNVSNNIGPAFPRGTIPADAGGATDDTDVYLVLNSTGNFHTAERTIEVVIEKTTITFPYGLYGKDLLRLGGSGEAHTDVGCNGDIEFTGGSPAVFGDADAGGTVTDPTYVTGTSTDGAEPEEFPDFPCPATAYGGVPAGAGVTLNAGGDLNLTGGSDKTYSAGTYYYRDFKKAGSGNIIIPVGEMVVIYVERELDVGASGFLNLNASASFLQVLACGTDATDWSFAGSAPVWLTIYAPRHDLTMTGGGDKHGTFVGKDVRTSGSANYFYDPGLMLPTGDYAIMPGSWTERGL